MNEVDGILNDITYQTIEMYGNHGPGSFPYFREYLEDIVLFEIMRQKMLLSFASNKEEVTDNIKVALIASGLSIDGNLPKGKSYIPKEICLTKKIYDSARERVVELDRERFTPSYPSKVFYTMVSSKESLNNVATHELLELGIAQSERNCGYVKENANDKVVCDKALKFLWNDKKKDLEEKGYKDSLEYSICEDVFEKNGPRHYSLATARALKDMVYIDSYIRIKGYTEFSRDYIEYVLRNIKAAKVTDLELMKKYEERFREILRNNNNQTKNNQPRLVKVRAKYE